MAHSIRFYHFVCPTIFVFIRINFGFLFFYFSLSLCLSFWFFFSPFSRTMPRRHYFFPSNWWPCTLLFINLPFFRFWFPQFVFFYAVGQATISISSSVRRNKKLLMIIHRWNVLGGGLYVSSRAICAGWLPTWPLQNLTFLKEHTQLSFLFISWEETAGRNNS